MSGIRPEWYSSVPEDVQSALVRANSSYRVIFNPKLQQYVVVVRDESVVQKFADGFLEGWSIATHFPGRLSVDQIIGYLRSHDKWRDEYLDEHAPAAMGPPGEKIKDRVARADDAVIDKAHAARDKESDLVLAGAIDEFLPDGRMHFGAYTSRGSQNAGDWWKKEEAALLDAQSRAHSSGKQRMWQGLAHLRSREA